MNTGAQIEEAEKAYLAPPPRPAKPAKKRFPRETAMEVFGEILESLGPWCERIALAGSARRERRDVGDLEILMVPKMGSDAAGLFNEDRVPIDLAELKLGELLGSKIIAKRPNIKGHFTWGPKNKLAVHVRTGLPIDFFTEPDIRCWYRSLVIRTGGADTNLRLTTGAQKRNRCLHAYGEKCLEDLSNGRISYPESEEDVFSFSGVEYLEPWQRM